MEKKPQPKKRKYTHTQNKPFVELSAGKLCAVEFCAILYE